jgi:Tol biopolymer transport system component
VFARLDQKREATALFTVRLDGTNIRRITPWSLDGLQRPDWSADGHWILFTKPTGADGATQLCLIHPDGTGLRQITRSPDSWWAWGSFSPDGTMLTAVREPGEASQNDLYVMNLDGTGMRPVTGSLSLEEAEGVPDWGPR